MKDERLYLIHIAECIEKIEKYTTEGKAVLLKKIELIHQTVFLYSGIKFKLKSACM